MHGVLTEYSLEKQAYLTNRVRIDYTSYFLAMSERFRSQFVNEYLIEKEYKVGVLSCMLRLFH